LQVRIPAETLSQFLDKAIDFAWKFTLIDNSSSRVTFHHHQIDGREASRSPIEELEASRLEPPFHEPGNQELSGKRQAIRNPQMSRIANAPDDTTATLGLNSGFKIIASMTVQIRVVARALHRGRECRAAFRA
jgi:hypothetical protein